MVDVSLSSEPNVERSAVLRHLTWGFCYWLAFLLVLEPDNLLKAEHAAHGLVLSQELIRILAAASLGALATPVLLTLARKYPVQGSMWTRHLVIQTLGSAAMAAVLILISCILADRFLASEHRPFSAALPQELQANWTLLTFAIGGLLAVAHAVRSRPNRDARCGTPEYVARLCIKSHGRVTWVDIADVDWLEAQGNYVALHTGSQAHLLRRPLTQLERQLDPGRFVRIHRRIIVAVDRIGVVDSLGGGDGLVRLKDGTELRLSRGFRDGLAAHIR